MWRAASEGEPPAIVQVGFAVEEDANEIDFEDPVVLTDGTADDVLEPEIDWKGSEGWTAAWIAQSGDTYAVQAMIEGGVPFSGEVSEEPIQELTLTCFDGTDSHGAIWATIWITHRSGLCPSIRRSSFIFFPSSF